MGAEVEKEEKAKEKARKRLEKAAAKYAGMKAPELRTELEKRKLSTKGKKAELMERLAVAVEKDKEKAAKKYLDKKLKEFEGMKDKELKKELQDRDLSTKGGRDDYMERLT